MPFAMLLGPEALTGEPSRRLAAVRARREHLDSQIEEHRRYMPRIVLIETEYQRAVTDAEVRWLSSVIDDLSSGKLSWDQEQLAAQATADYFQADSP